MPSLEILSESLASDPLGAPVFLRFYQEEEKTFPGHTATQRQFYAVVSGVLLVEFPAILAECLGEPGFDSLSIYEKRKRVRTSFRDAIQSLLDRYSEKYYPAIPRVQAYLTLSFDRAQLRDDFLYLHAT